MSLTPTSKSSPFVSIVIPCFNAERFVAEAIRSALEQTYPHKEVIVIDDGSNDQSIEVLRSFGSSIHWETGPNRGACAARNRGVTLAQGELIQFLDADDWLYPLKLDKQVTATVANPDITTVCDWDEYIDGQKRRTHSSPPSCEKSLVPLLHITLDTASPLHRKPFLQRVGGFREELPCAQERDLHLRMACHGWRLQRIPEPLYASRLVASGVSSNYERVLDQHAGVATRIRDLLLAQNEWTDANAREVAGWLTRDARAFFGLGCQEKASHYFSLAKDFHQSGGWETAYGRLARLGATLLGPITLERLRLRLRRR